MVGIPSSLSLLAFTVGGLLVYNYWPDDSEGGVKGE